jgi:hypothetical protein
MRHRTGVLGVFAASPPAVAAIGALRAAGYRDVRAAMPVLYHEVLQALGRPRSRLGIFTMTGALVGTVAGFALCIATSLSWSLVTGGKPIAALPPFVVIAFELSVLFGALVNLTGLAIGALTGRLRRGVPRDVRFTDDRIGIFVVGGDPEAAERILQAAGALEVRRVA